MRTTAAHEDLKGALPRPGLEKYNMRRLTAAGAFAVHQKNIRGSSKLQHGLHISVNFLVEEVICTYQRAHKLGHDGAVKIQSTLYL